jgi:hypothetical protein
MDNAEILAMIDTATKSVIDVTDLGKAVLAETHFAQFVQAMQSKTVILPAARFIQMDTQIVDIDRVGFVGRIMTSGTSADGTQKVLAEGEFAKPQFDTNQLIAKETQAVVGLKDTAARRNIEKEQFTTTLVNLMGEAAGRDIEEWGLLADTDISVSDDLFLHLTDGWAKLAANAVYGVGASKDFDPAATYNKDSLTNYPENMFDAMIAALPKQYLQARSEWRFYVPFSSYDAYGNLLRMRGTVLGDQAQTSGDPIPYKGIPVEVVPMIERSATIGDGGKGSIALLSHPDNMAWGVFHEVTVEPDRIPKSRRTDFVLTVEGDAGYEDENAAVVAYIDGENPGT